MKKPQSENKGKRAGGRPSKFTPEIRKRILLLSTHQLTDAQICEMLAIPERTFYDWQSQNPEFSQDIKKARDQRLQEVERNMYLRANGTHFDEVSEEFELKKIYDPDAKTYVETAELVLARRRITKKWLVPEVGAGIFILCNRKPKEWRNIQKVDIEGKVDASLSLMSLMKMAGEARKRKDAAHDKAKGRGLGTAEILS